MSPRRLDSVDAAVGESTRLVNVTASFQTQGDFHGWFFWNFRMEETVYREWDYLRGVKEGWIPKLVRGETVEAQTGTNCARLEEEALACTTEVVDPFPKIPHWKGIPCIAPSPAEVASLFLLKAFACVGVGAIILFVLYALRYGFAAAWAKLRACCTRGGSLEMARRKEFAPINDGPSSYDTNNPINVAA